MFNLNQLYMVKLFYNKLLEKITVLFTRFIHLSVRFIRLPNSNNLILGDVQPQQISNKLNV